MIVALCIILYLLENNEFVQFIIKKTKNVENSEYVTLTIQTNNLPTYYKEIGKYVMWKIMNLEVIADIV